MNESNALPDGATTQPVPGMSLWQRIRQVSSVEGLWFGLVALILAIHAESILMPAGKPAVNPDVATATRWYVVAILIFVIGWWGTYRDVSLLRFPTRGRDTGTAWLRDRETRTRIAIFALGLLVNVVAVELLRHDWYSAVGGWLWVVGLALLVAAGIRARASTAPVDDQAEDVTTNGWSLHPWIEISVVVLILTIAITMRLWRLGDLLPGMHGDEGEGGSIALTILHGIPVSPFTRGWFNHSNVSFWSLAVFMKMLGPNLVGLRMFAVVCGVLTTLFVYLIGREMFGVRAGLFAGAFMAFQSADLLFSRMVLPNAATPTLSVISYYFLIRGLRTRKHFDFILTGIAAGFSVYYFAGGRIDAPVAVAVLVYLALLHRAFLRAYWSQALVLVLAAGATATPFLAYMQAFPIRTNDYPNNRFVWQNFDLLVQTYGTNSWPTILWDQLQRSLSLLTYSVDISANNILDYPPVRPIEAVLIVLGLAWAAVRFRDTRFALLSIWFWTTVIAGGMLTVDQPNLPRLCGALPVLPLLMAAVLDRFAGQFAVAVRQFGGMGTGRHLGQWIGSAVAVAAIAVAGVQNWQMYITSYLNTHQNPNVTGQALFVQQHGLKYRYYDMGHPMLYFTHGDNRFINYAADGIDVVNPSNLLPLVDNGPTGMKDAIFMIWAPMYSYLPIVRAYYPEARLQAFPLGDAADPVSPLYGILISHQSIDKHRTLLAHYQGSSGTTVSRREPNLGTPATLPAGLHYPVHASWTGGLVAPAYDTYHFKVEAPSGAELIIDGTRVLSIGTGAATADAAIDLAQGIHNVGLTARLGSRNTKVRVLWHSSVMPRRPVSHVYLWDNHVRGQWYGETHSIPGAGIAGPVRLLGGPERRIDGFLGFRSTGQAFGISSGIQGTWSSRLSVRRAGLYHFQLNALEGATLAVDGHVVVDDPAAATAPQLAQGSVHLSRGSHRVRISYTWQSGIGYLEAFWQPPGNKSMQLMLSPSLAPDRAGTFPPGGAQTP